MFKAVYGTAEYDGGAYLFEKIKENISKDIKTYILVPEQFSVFTERRIIAALGVSAQNKAEVLTFSRLSNLVLSELGPLRLGYVDGAGKEILAARTMQLIEKKLDYFLPNAHQKGFSKLMAELVSEFKRYGHDPESLRAAAEKTGGGKSELSRKLMDMALFYETYDGLINKSGADAEDNLALAVPKIKDFGMPENSFVIVSEFRSFTPLEQRALIELVKKSSEFRLILCCDDPERPDDLFAVPAGTYRALQDAAAAAGAEIGRPEKLKYQKPMAPDIRHMVSNYFRTRPEKYKKPAEHVHFMRPESYMDEVETAAAIIHRLCRERGLRQSDFLILARDAEEYSGIMPLVFEDYGINVFLDKRRSLTENPYLLYLSAVLDVLARGFSYERVMTLAKSGFCEGLSVRERDIFENYLLAVNPSRAMWNSADEWSFNPDKSTFDIEMINSVKAKVLDPVTKLKKSIKGRKTAGDIVGALLGFIERGGHRETMRGVCESLTSRGLVYLAEEYRMAWNSVISVLGEIGAIMGETPMTYEKFYELFTSACAGIKVGVSPQTIDGASLSRIDMFRSAGVKVVIVLGVTEGVFPGIHSGEGLISDAERRALRDEGFELAMTAEEKTMDENMLIYNVLSAASDEIYFMSPRSSGSDTLNPSRIVTKLKEVIFDAEYEEAENIPETRNAALRELKRRRAAGLGGDGTETLAASLKDDEGYKRFLNRLENAERGYETLSKDAVTRLYGRDIMLSASKLERFNGCAFSYFMRYGLAAAPREPASFDPLSMGSVLHGALERYFDGKTDFESVTREQCRKEINAIIEDIAGSADEIMYRSSAYYKYLIMRMSGIASTTAWETIKFFRVSKFRPIGFEVRIGDDGKIPPIRIHTENGDASVEGFVDRVDGAEIDGKKYISVVDYKSSKKTLDQPLAEAGVKFQPLVYTNALCRADGSVPAAMLYQQMNDPIIESGKADTEEKYEKEVRKEVAASGWVIKEALGDFAGGDYAKARNFKTFPLEEMEKRLENAEKKIAESAEGILSGEISVNPYTEYGHDPCLFCDYAKICGQDKKFTG